MTRVCNSQDPYYFTLFISKMKFNYFALIVAIVKNLSMMDAENLHRETDPLNVDPFAFIDVWSSDSVPSKASESSYNRSFTYFDEAVAKFQRMEFDQPPEDSLSNPYYKP